MCSLLGSTHQIQPQSSWLPPYSSCHCCTRGCSLSGRSSLSSPESRWERLEFSSLAVCITPSGTADTSHWGSFPLSPTLVSPCSQLCGILSSKGLPSSSGGKLRAMARACMLWGPLMLSLPIACREASHTWPQDFCLIAHGFWEEHYSSMEYIPIHFF